MTLYVFYVFAALAIISAVLCILQKSPVSAALWLISVMFHLAGVYLLLDAQFIALIQILVYAGAVMVLFLFVIMLLNLGRTSRDLNGPGLTLAGVVLVALLSGELLLLRGPAAAGIASELAGMQPQSSGNVVADIAAPLFTQYLVPFEITSILLLAAVVGAVVLAKRKI